MSTAVREDVPRNWKIRSAKGPAWFSGNAQVTVKRWPIYNTDFVQELPASGGNPFDATRDASPIT